MEQTDFIVLGVGHKAQCSFKCSGCGKCCQDMDCISVRDYDIKRLSKYLGIKAQEFKAKYVEMAPVKIPGRDTSVDQPSLKLEHHTCPFYNKGCTVYEARPEVCRDFPYNSENFLLTAMLRMRSQLGLPICGSDRCPETTTDKTLEALKQVWTSHTVEELISIGMKRWKRLTQQVKPTKP